jgi:quinol monooxygenase YgiN
VFIDKENPIFGESITHVSIDDDAAGGYIVLEQFSDEGAQKIKLDLPELEEILRLANKLIKAYDHLTKTEEKKESQDEL